MGRVFSFEDIRQGAVPEPVDFYESLEGFSDAVETEVRRGVLDGAIVYGSVAIGAYSRRSDFDCMIVPKDYSQPSIQAIRRVMAASNPSGKVQVNPITHSRSRLASGNHEIDRFFLDHLSGDGRLVYGDDPAGYMRSANQSPADILYNYVHHKKRTVASTFHIEGDEKYKHLARILELPLAIGRKALRACDELDGTVEARFNTAEKAKLARRAIMLFSSIGFNEAPESIMRLDRNYSALLNQALAGEITEQEYSYVIDDIEGAAPQASEWLDDLEIALRKKIF